MRIVTLGLSIVFASLLWAQDTLVTVKAPDRAVIGEMFEVTWTVHARTDSVQKPVMDDVLVADGPYASSSFSSENGALIGTETYTYRVKAFTSGDLQLPTFRVRIKGAWYSSPAKVMTITGHLSEDAKRTLQSRKMAARTELPDGSLIMIVHDNTGYLMSKDSAGSAVVKYLSPEEASEWKRRLEELKR
jgi:hypothetical protein